MKFELILELMGDMALLAMTANFIGRNRYIASCAERPTAPRCWLTLTIIFSVLSILGTYTGVPVEGALANTRLVGTIMGGIMGGPWVGLSIGFISGLHRYLIGGFTAEICGAATLLGGLMAGMARQKYGLHGINWKKAALLALAAEGLQKGMVLLLAKPFAAAWALEKAIAVPTTVVTMLGTVVFMLILKDIKTEQELHGAKAAQLSLEIASRTLPFLRHGLTMESAQKTAEIIFAFTGMDAVSISNREQVLAFVGKGADHHKPGEPIMTQSTKQTIISGTLHIVHTAQEQGCPVAGCPLQSSVVAPLVVNGAVIGTVKLNRAVPNGITEVDIRIAEGIAHLLSVQIELAEVDCQRKMREKAELKALQAQINPHFLFNTINIIMSFCRTNPDTARSLLGHLATMLRHSFAERQDFITLKEEMEGIAAYLEIVKARFGSRLTVITDLDPQVLDVPIPLLTLQPLVENAVQHGLFPKLSHCVLTIAAYRQDRTVVIDVRDNGVGVPAEKLRLILAGEGQGIGIRNVHKRLTGIYGKEYGLTIESTLGQGTTARIVLPYEGRDLAHAG
ncbi:LytS/YhcK type 5TM receptor domain-containing protein [Sporolituus thermophilus]|uniref:histidine kinase n=1 Tax=Sporolituus thermophilus DSM 23256 TaxID=1123285 RepID=A0A1G7N807_9FIRM|nr:LytS/YhcK type 5TM receptor domain-containing protein [Sporolituus thermophilus]SDF69489.1 two-component system, LytT family, sensor histidine kinase LytS [Sporolituus thermophilus DSM 23256]